MHARRLVNLARKLARLATKTRVETPREVQLEVTNRCNLDCDMCPRLTLLKVPEVDMTWETFTSVLSRLDSPESITLTGWGEPLMHPRIFEFIAEIKRRWESCDVSFTTNAHFFTDAFIAKILAAKVSRVNVSLEELPWSEAVARTPSLHGVSSPAAPFSIPTPSTPPPPLPVDFRTGNPMKGHENYVARDGHPTPPKVVDRLRRFLDAVNNERARGNDFPEVRMQVVLFPEGTEVMLRLVDFAAEAGFHAVNLVRLDVRGRPDLRRPSFDEERAMIALARERAAQKGVPLGSVNDHGKILRLASHNDRFCVRLDNFIYVDVSGNVAPCCLLRGHKLGNLVEQPLKEVWQSDRFKRFYGPGVHPACVGCDAFLHCHAEEPALERTPRALPIASVARG